MRKTMTRKDRLMATLRGEPVDRPAVCFYELNGYDEQMENPDPFHIYADPSWKPLIELTRDKTDRIVMRTIPFYQMPTELDKRTTITNYYDELGRKHCITEIKAEERILRQHTRRDAEINTIWTIEHLLKDEDDLAAWIGLPDCEDVGQPDYRDILEVEKNLGDTGIVMIDIGDALCEVASLFSMEDYTIMAMMEPLLFKQALDKVQKNLRKKVEIIAKELPGHLWRIYGPEYATPPYLPPSLYQEYVVGYDKELIEIIHQYNGFARIHQHGKLKDVLDLVAETGCMAIDPIEPAPQGDVTLEYVRKKYGRQLVLFGNLEISDIELMEPEEFEKKVITAIEEGTKGQGRGFVLMPSASPYGRKLSEKAFNNYKKIIEVVERCHTEV